MWENPKHIIVPVFFNYRGTALFHEDPVKVKANPNGLQKFMGLFNQKYLPTDEIRYQKHFYYGFEFNPREVKATQCLMGGIFDFFHARGLTFNYPDISNRKGTEIWIGEYKCHLFDIMADIRNPQRKRTCRLRKAGFSLWCSGFGQGCRGRGYLFPGVSDRNAGVE
ncbi:hypothetical protein [Acetobacter fabarum]|uniref:hypothetical protein n=1 Tax=Acetobacter fabarum TaxID=483199 RepID=UPI000BF06B73|nr:hypothetical protein [Acetobacter fabarum]PEN25284.1 hypothetical protein CRM93_09800 [Acetobacter fabarum]